MLTGPALVVTFICNHCPYVQHVAGGLAALGRDLTDQGVAMVAISSNHVVSYPQDGPDQMVAEARRHGWTFPYLYDKTHGDFAHPTVLFRCRCGQPRAGSPQRRVAP